jgi:hypothetical protein
VVLSDASCAVLSDPNPVVPSDPDRCSLCLKRAAFAPTGSPHLTSYGFTSGFCTVSLRFH